MDIPQHPSGLNQRVVAKVFARRGRLHAFETLNPCTTALIVIYMMQASIELDEGCREIVPNINRLAKSVRDAGGLVAWVTVAPTKTVSQRLVDLVGAKQATLFYDMAQGGDPRALLWHELATRQNDIHTMKRGASAFFPGKCDLHERLQENDIDTVLITGTVTNVCCESSARDAAELGYRIIMVSDANRGQAHGLHEASLTTFYRIFGDVRPTSEVISLIATDPE